jgi:hypothetical protein
MSYTKLAKSILTSTLWMEDDHTRIAWLTMLAMADKNGEVQASIPGLANVARIPVESARAAIVKFLSPDPDSRTKDDEGRRIQEIKGGWLLINHAEYRQLASDEDRKAKAAERQQRMRDKLKRNTSHAPITPASHQIPQAEANPDPDPNASKVDLQAPACEPTEDPPYDLDIPHPDDDDGVPVEEKAEPPKPAARAPRPKNVLGEALLEACRIDPATATKSQWGQACKALKEIKEAYPPVTPADLHSLADALRKEWGAKVASFTPMALATHWRTPTQSSPSAAQERIPTIRSDDELP